MCLKFSEELLDCRLRQSGRHLPWVCLVQSFCFVSCTSVAVGGAAEMSLEHEKGGWQAGIVMLLLLALLGKEILPLGAALTVPLQFRELSCDISSAPPFLQPYLPCRQTSPFVFLELFC